jgi:Domain of unknown function (DUF3576)
MTTRKPLIVVLLLGAAALAACTPSGPPAQPNYTGSQGPQPGDPSILTGTGLDIGIGNKVGRDSGAGGAGAGTGIGVNAYLWRGALDTLGFMPLASADPFGGVIITDWYTPAGSSGERFKATAYILGRQLRSDGIKVAIFRQVLENGQWVDAPVSPTTSGEIEDKVLARARQLREQSNPS